MAREDEPLTTTFTQPPFCSDVWVYLEPTSESLPTRAYRGTFANSFTDCFPSSTIDAGFSPGLFCFDGWKTVHSTKIESGEARVNCCPSDYSWSSPWCTKTTSNANVSVTIYQVTSFTISVPTVLTITASPLRLTQSFSEPPSPTNASSSGGNTNGNPPGGLSSGAKAGIGVGVAIPVILIIIAVFFVWRRRRAAREKNDATGETDVGTPSMTKHNSDVSPKHTEDITNVTGITGAPGDADNNKDAKVVGVASTNNLEVDSTSRENELDAVNNQRHELGATVRDAHELMSSQYYELDPSDRPARSDAPIAPPPPQKIESRNFESNAKPESESTGDGENEVYQAALDAIASEEERLRKRRAALLAHHKSDGNRTE